MKTKKKAKKTAEPKVVRFIFSAFGYRLMLSCIRHGQNVTFYETKLRQEIAKMITDAVQRERIECSQAVAALAKTEKEIKFANAADEAIRERFKTVTIKRKRFSMWF